ncbi:MAG: hypothetical protein IKF70_00450, partial [Firmicutes bacterium]|nr:hypothetical protein [Bacillota bacterium]
MIKRLRRRVIAITMLAVFVVLFVLMGVANLANYHLKDRNADELLEILAENGGRFPHQGPGGGQGFPGMGGEPFDDADNDTDDADDDTDDADDAADDASGDAERDP